MLIQSIVYGSINHTFVCAFTLFIGFYAIMMDFGQIVQRKYQNVSEHLKDKTNKKVKDELFNAIRIHSNVKELS